MIFHCSNDLHLGYGEIFEIKFWFWIPDAKWPESINESKGFKRNFTWSDLTFYDYIFWWESMYIPIFFMKFCRNMSFK